MTDDQLEDLLVRQGQAWRAAQPAAPSLGALTGRSRTARAPWLLPALVAAAVLVLVVGTVTVLRQPGPHRASGPAASPKPTASPAVPVLVPWADIRATGTQDPDRLGTRPGTSASPSGAAKPCAAGDFTADDDAATPASGPGAPVATGQYVLTVQRTGTRPCAIGNSTPMVNLLDAAGNSLGIGGSSLLVAYPGYTVLLPGDLVQVPARICGTGIASLELRLTAAPADPDRIGGRDGAKVAVPFPGESTCAAGYIGTSQQRVVPAGSLASLVRSYSVPSRVRSGQSLRYTVTLTNPAATAVSLDPCPAYRQSLIDVLKLPDKRGVTRTGQLNCARAPASVPAHASIVLQMQLDTSGVPLGDRRLVWDWLGSAWTDAQGYGEFPVVKVY